MRQTGDLRPRGIPEGFTTPIEGKRRDVPWTVADGAFEGLHNTMAYDMMVAGRLRMNLGNYVL